jgi:hypothetical protein
MKKLWYLLAILLCGAMMALVIGCSDDDGTGPDDDLTPGDPASGDFAFVEGNVGETPFMSLGTSLDMSMRLLDSIPGAPPSPERRRGRISLAQEDDWDIVSLEFSYLYSGGWHQFTYNAVAAHAFDPDTADLAGTDSVQILDGTTPLQYPTGVVDGLKIRNHFTWMLRNTEDSIKADHAIDITGDVVENTTFFTVNGSGTDILHAQVSDESTTCDLDVTYTHTINNIKAYFQDDECPFAGTVSVTCAIDLSCASASSFDSLNVNGSWTITASYSDDLETITYRSGDVFWTVTQECVNSDPNDRAYEVFLEQLAGEEGDEIGGVNGINQLLLTSAFIFVGTIFDETPSRTPGDFASLGDTSLTYDAQGGWWIGTFVDTSTESGEIFTIIDSIQFKHGNDAVQYPDPLQLTEVLLHNWLYVEAELFDTAWVRQHFVITAPSPTLDSVYVNGTGYLALVATFVETLEGDTTTCDVDMGWELAVANLGFATDSIGVEGLPCPFSGTQAYIAMLENVCVGAYPGELMGTWTVNAVYGGGEIDVTISNGAKTWQFIDQCN